MERFRKLFPAAEKYIYMNSAAVSPIPTTAVDAVTTQLADVSSNGSNNFAVWLATKERARSLLASMICVEPEQIAFVRNTSDAIASVANGIDWKAGDNIVSFEKEFPSNFYAWRNVRDRFGVELRMVPEVEGRFEIDDMIALIDERTKVVAVSAIQFASGFRADLERLGAAARAYDALFVVDIIQALGATSFDLPALGVDVAAGASHKWLCAPEGCGYVYLSDRARERVEPTLVGWISVVEPWDFEAREQEFRPTALAWESGTGAAALFYGLEASLKVLAEAGLSNIEKHLGKLTDRLCDGLAGLNYEIVSSRAPGEKSAIVCIKHRGGLTSTEIFKRLESEGIIVSPRGDRLRIAPHFYNDESDVDALLATLP